MSSNGKRQHRVAARTSDDHGHDKDRAHHHARGDALVREPAERARDHQHEEDRDLPVRILWKEKEGGLEIC